MNGWYDDFDTLYDLYDTGDPDIYIGDYLYQVETWEDEKNPYAIHVTVIDYEHIPKGESIHDPKYLVEEKLFKNSFEFVNNYKFYNGKTLAQMMCDANGWNYSILPVYPKWYSPLFGDTRYIKTETEEEKKEWKELLAKREKEEQEDWEKSKKRLLADGKMEEYNDMVRIENLTKEELEKEVQEHTRQMSIKQFKRQTKC